MQQPLEERPLQCWWSLQAHCLAIHDTFQNQNHFKPHKSVTSVEFIHHKSLTNLSKIILCPNAVEALRSNGLPWVVLSPKLQLVFYYVNENSPGRLSRVQLRFHKNQIILGVAVILLFSKSTSRKACLFHVVCHRYLS